MLKDDVIACRSCRRFIENERISRELLVDLVDTARLVSSSGNRQPLRYAVVSDPQACAQVFDCLSWAAALPDWLGPEEGERPSGYIVVLRDEDRMLGELFTAWDEGIAAQTIMLAARAEGCGGCIIGAFKKKSLAGVIGIDDGSLTPDLVIALGKPAEDVRIAELPDDGSITYWRDENRVHYVPKRPLEDVLVQQL